MSWNFSTVRVPVPQVEPTIWCTCRDIFRYLLCFFDTTKPIQVVISVVTSENTIHGPRKLFCIFFCVQVLDELYRCSRASCFEGRHVQDEYLQWLRFVLPIQEAECILVRRLYEDLMQLLLHVRIDCHPELPKSIDNGGKSSEHVRIFKQNAI